MRGFSTEPGSTVALRAELIAGRVPLPERKAGDSLVSGLLGAAELCLREIPVVRDHAVRQRFAGRNTIMRFGESVYVCSTYTLK